MDHCLTNSDLERLHAGDMDVVEQTAARAHLNACEACRQRDAALVAGHQALVADSREAHADGSPEPAETMPAPGNAPATPPPWRRPSAQPLIEGYEITRELSRGGQGVVYQAVQKSTKRKVAIKVLLEGPYASKAAQKRFEREIELVAQLKHPHIISIFDSGSTSDGRQFCVMDYVRGVPLHHYVRDKKLSLEDTLTLFGTVCEGVQYAHQRGVIHRDLKPSNILVDVEGNPKIMDFGLAKLMSGPVETLVSISQQVVGTLPYMSPEQARGNPDEIDTRTDIYALGVILYEVLTGHYPYPVVGQMADVLRHIAETPPTPPSRQWTPDSGVTHRSTKHHRLGACPIDDEVQTIVLRALTKERERRYQSAGELGKDLHHYLRNEPIEAKRDSALYVLRKQLRRYRVPIAVAATFFLLIVGAGIVSIGLYARAEEQRQRAENALRESKAGIALGNAKVVWSKGLAAVDSKEMSRFASVAFEAARNKATEAEREGAAGRNERAAALYGEASAALRQAVEAAAAAKLAAQVERLVALLARAAGKNDRLNASSALGKLAALVPGDARLAAWLAKADALAWPKSAGVELGDGVTLELVRIEAGEFKMGSDDSQDLSAQPVHTVRITKPFYMGKTEVTQAQWRSEIGNNPSFFKGNDLPVESVSWEDCQAFCDKLSVRIGLTARLPTEAEWEYACRAGSRSGYSFGNSESDLADYGWCNSNSKDKTHRVGAKKPNAWGLYDMHGNVWEWCADRYGEYPKGEQKDPTGPASGQGRVLRGGGWYYGPSLCRSALRNGYPPAFRYGSFGLRVVVLSSGTP